MKSLQNSEHSGSFKGTASEENYRAVITSSTAEIERSDADSGRGHSLSWFAFWLRC